MILLIGLGNPGLDYDSTRHNAGKLFARYLAEHSVEGVEAIETECYMNESGGWLQRELQRRGITSITGTTSTTDRRKLSQIETQHGTRGTSLIIAHDDLDIPLGNFKIQFGKGPRQHKGILSIEAVLGTTEFWRVRIGVDARKKDEGKRQKEVSGEEYVLQPFSREERKTLETVFPRIREQLQVVFRTLPNA